MQNDFPISSAILFVDDDPAIIDLFRLNFDSKYTIFTAESGERGLEIYEDNPDIGVILSDHKMAGMSGVEFLNRIYLLNPDTIRIVVTAYAEYENILEAVNHGHIYQYVIKPWDPAHLAGVIERAIDRWRLLQENRWMVKETARMNDQLKELSLKLLHAEESERKRISMELHDDIGQNLIALKMQFTNFCSKLEAQDPEEIRQSKAIVLNTLQKSIENTRNICNRLNPIIDEFGFDTIFAEFVENFERDYGIRTIPARIDIQHYFDKSDQHQLYRILQEVFNNIGKHSGTEQVFMETSTAAGFFTLNITDHGCGFTPDDHTPETSGRNGYGLENIRHRAAALGGTIDIASSPGKGTRFSLRLPIAGD